LQTAIVSIVDDDESVREATKDLLLSLGYATAAFGSAEEFLGSPDVDRTACLITDVRMPGLSGVELQHSLRAQGYGMPIIFITAFPDERQLSQARTAGATRFLTKPFEEEMLIESLDAALAATRRV
jgi:FixJ family two-component response regulator